MPKEMDLEVKVGAFVLAAIACLVVFVLSISDFSVFKKGESYQVMFQFANGLKKGAPVRVAGVDAGHVRKIRVFYDPVRHVTDIDVDVWMERGHSIPADSTFMINQLGLLGEKYLEIIPGSSAVLLVPGATVHGEDPIPMERITKTLGSMGAKVDATLTGINTGILSEANKAAFAAMLANGAAVSASLREGDGTVAKFLTDPSVYRNLDELSAELKANPWKLFYRPKGK